MEHGPFEDVFPIKDGDIPASSLSLPGGRWIFSNVDVKKMEAKGTEMDSSRRPNFLKRHFVRWLGSCFFRVSWLCGSNGFQRGWFYV